MEPVVVVSTGVANTASVSAAIRRCGFEVELTADSAQIRGAERVVLPGVGSFEAGMRCLRSRGLAGLIRERVEEERPLLAICLGLQLLCRDSAESPGVAGVGAIEAGVCRLPAGVRVPQFGWNRVEATRSSAVRDGYAYYANSYCIIDCPDGWTVATSTYGGEFVAALERGPVLACQFHPELSGVWGSELIKRWLVREGVGSTC